MTAIRQQLRNNAVALISLTVAIGSLAYNTWRNERTEHNRNVRTAAFELLMRAGDLERVTFLAQYDRDRSGGSPRSGWTDVLAIRDLAALVPGAVPARATELLEVWGANWEGLGKDDETAVNRIDDAIGGLREAALGTLRSLR
ncbi:MAG TPA: hypothetical protein VMU44_01185 [Steroidobacteraceae bacterium]|nr:hypothetical protein [Steroidobacteraceae bacterium]